MCDCRQSGGTLKLNEDGKEASAARQERQVAAKARNSIHIDQNKESREHCDKLLEM
jgi:hypothetical protein